MSLEEITIKQVNQGFGFVKPVELSMQGVMFPNGKIAYLDNDENISTAYDEKCLIRNIKQDKTCVDVQVIHSRKKK